MPTWWLISTATTIPPSRDNSHQSVMRTDTLNIPGGSEKRLSTISDIDLLKTPEQSRSRSNSMKSQNSSSKSAQVFQRAGSFRHKIKSDSLSCSSHVSEGNIAKLGALPGFLAVNEDSTTCRLLPSPKAPSIIIQVDEAC